MRSSWGVLATVGLALIGASEVSAATPPITIIDLVNPAHGKAFNDALRARAAAFNRDHPGIVVKLQQITGNYNDKVASMLAAGDPPDVLHVVNSDALTFLPLSAMADMATLAKQDNLDLSARLALPALKALQSDGVQFGLPIFAQAIAVDYNADLVAAAGLETPRELAAQGAWTWQAYLDAARKMTIDTNGDNQPDQWGTGINTAMNRWPIWVWQAGGTLFDRPINPTKSLFESAPVRQALTYYTSWQTDWGVAGGSFGSGNQGLNPFDSSWSAGNFRTAPFDWDVAAMPDGPAGNPTGLFLNNVQILAQDPAHRSAAWQWVKFLTLNVDSVVAFMGSSGRTPALLDAFSTYLSHVTKPEGRKIWLDALANSRPMPIYPHAAQIRSVVTNELKAVLSKQESVDTATSRMQQQVDALLAGEG